MTSDREPAAEDAEEEARAEERGQLVDPVAEEFDLLDAGGLLQPLDDRARGRDRPDAALEPHLERRGQEAGLDAVEEVAPLCAEGVGEAAPGRVGRDVVD